MPTISSSPRSAGSTPRGGRLASAPRSSGSSSSRRTSSTPRSLTGLTSRQAKTFQAAQLASLSSKQKEKTGVGPGFTPIRVLLNAVSAPGYAIGNLAAGRQLDAAKNILSAGQLGKKTFLSDALRERGVLPGGWAGTALGLGLDIATDPVTYVTFGAGGVAKQAGTQAAKKVTKVAMTEGRRVTLAERALASAASASARSSAPKAVSVGFRVPFTRGKVLPLAESKALPRIAGKVGRKVVPKRARDGVASGARSGNAADPVVNEVYQDVRRLAAIETGEMNRAARAGNIATRKAAKKIGMTEEAATEAISDYLSGAIAKLPDERLAPLAEDARRLLDMQDAAEIAAGIEKGHLPDYIPFLVAKPGDRAKYERLFGRPTANAVDDPFFVKPRETPDFATFKALMARHDIAPETNIWKLIERRGRASSAARTKKAVDDAVITTHGVKAPPRALPKAERKRGAVQLANERAAARLGREVSPEDFASLRDEWIEIGTATKYHDGTLLPPRVAEALQRIHTAITPTIRDEDSLVALGRFTRNMTSRWKALALLSPGYHIRNMIDDSLRAYWAGARNPASFVQATRVLRGGSPTIKIGKQTYTRKQLIDLAESEGVIRTGWVRTEIQSSADGVTSRPPIPGANIGRGKVTGFSNAVGDLREDSMRLGLFLELLKKGDDSNAAARTVREFLFDYGEVGKFVESARQFWLPFVTFTAKALPFTLKHAVTNPGRLASVNKAMSASSELAGNPDMSYVPPWMADSFAIPSSPGFRRAIGAPEDQELLFDPMRVTGFATADILDLRPDSARQNILGGMVTPYVKSPVEAITGYSTFRGRVYRDGERVFAPQLIQIAAKYGIPIPGYGPKEDTYTREMGVGYSPALDTILRMLPAYGQAGQVLPARSEATRLGATKYFGGVPISPYDRVRGAYFADRFGK